MFFYCDVAGPRYRVQDFRPVLEQVGVFGETAAMGPFHMNHVWLTRMKSLAANEGLLAAKELTVKAKRCVLVDPSNAGLEGF